MSLLLLQNAYKEICGGNLKSTTGHTNGNGIEQVNSLKAVLTVLIEEEEKKGKLVCLKIK